MAVFTQANMHQLDWLILRDGPIALYFNEREMEEACHWFENHVYRVYRFNSIMWASGKEDFYETIGQALSFPNYCGHNLDSFRDCLSYVEVPQEGGIVLTFLQFDRLANRFPKFAYSVLDIIAEISRFNLLLGQHLIALVHSGDQKLSFQPVGACPIVPINWKPTI